jgi:hypothetical protein
MTKKSPSEDLRSQVEKFRDLARELDSDEDETHFEERVRRIADGAPKQEKRSGRPEGDGGG